MTKLIFVPLIFMCSCATFNISMVHSEGTADDLIDNDMSPKTDVSSQVEIPGAQGKELIKF